MSHSEYGNFQYVLNFEPNTKITASLKFYI